MVSSRGTRRLTLAPELLASTRDTVALNTPLNTATCGDTVCFDAGSILGGSFGKGGKRVAVTEIGFSLLDGKLVVRVFEEEETGTEQLAEAVGPRVGSISLWGRPGQGQGREAERPQGGKASSGAKRGKGDSVAQLDKGRFPQRKKTRIGTRGWLLK